MTKDEANALLIGAAEKGLVSDVQSALAAGADVHTNDDYALKRASERGYSEVVKILLSSGADVHACNGRALRGASDKGHVEVVKILLEAGANVHAMGSLALIYASYNGHAEVAKVLLEAGADVHVANDWAFQEAHKMKRTGVIQLFFEAGRWDEKCDDGRTYFERFRESYNNQKMVCKLEKFMTKKQKQKQAAAVRQRLADQKKLAVEFAERARVQAEMLALAQTLPKVKIKQKR